MESLWPWVIHWCKNYGWIKNSGLCDQNGDLNPEINALYALQSQGSFSNKVTFDPIGGR